MERPPIYDNRELSWLKFNERVLEEAQDESMPLYERLGFVSIFHNNLDEFFMVRVGSLHDQTLLKRETRENKTNLTAQEQLDLIAPRVGYLLGVKDETFAHIMGRLSERGIVHADMSSLSDEENKYLETFFTREILPIVSPSIIDGQHLFPFLQNKEIYIGVELSSKSKSPTVGIIPCQPLSGRIIYLPGQGVRFVLIEDLILHFAHKVFNGFSVQKRWLLRITRNADINVQEALYDHDIDFRDAMGELLKKRKKLSPVRMELSDDIGGKLTQWFCEKLDLAQARVYVESAPLDLSFVWQLEGAIQSQKELFFNPLTPQKSVALKSGSVIEQVSRKDVLLSYPYESIRPFIRLLEEAANDPMVISLKITLYRVANESKVIEELISAAENGKTVTVLLELRARFDEENNINWSKRLEDAGCNVIYGLEELKVHSKLLLITRRSGQGIEYITQIGTGNYNEKTSRLYTDYSLMTANREIG
ncbi:MAG TPA: polyphosphate kinase 1, partial [Oscillospiraceae bacterium]|nr:polyphosphate kinase 1 [Oscillospiraceae bacterium]